MNMVTPNPAENLPPMPMLVSLLEERALAAERALEHARVDLRARMGPVTAPLQDVRFKHVVHGSAPAVSEVMPSGCRTEPSSSKSGTS